MPTIVDEDSASNGGSPILSYSLEWDQGGGGLSFVALTGSDSDGLTVEQTITGLSAGASYQFRYRVRNTYGWGDYSDILTAVAASPPDTPV
jgi:hypothetical protein